MPLVNISTYLNQSFLIIFNLFTQNTCVTKLFILYLYQRRNILLKTFKANIMTTTDAIEKIWNNIEDNNNLLLSIECPTSKAPIMVEEEKTENAARKAEFLKVVTIKATSTTANNFKATMFSVIWDNDILCGYLVKSIKGTLHTKFLSSKNAKHVLKQMATI